MERYFGDARDLNSIYIPFMWIMGLGSMFETLQPRLLLCMGSVKNEEDAGRYFKGKYRAEGVTMMWVRVRMWMGVGLG